MSRPRFNPNPFTDIVPRRGATSSKAGLDVYRRVSSIEQAIASNTSIDTDSLNLYRALGSAILTYNYDPGTILNTADYSQGLTSGTIYASAVYLPKPATITGVVTYQTTAGVMTTTIARLGIYDYSGNRLAITNNDTALWKSTGIVQQPLNATKNLDRGLYYIAFINVRSATTTTPAIAGRPGFATLQNLLTSSSFPRNIFLDSQSDLPTSTTFSSWSLAATTRWCGLY